MISIIIPTYNRAQYLKEALDSVLSQDYFSNAHGPDSYELIVIDDGSTDETRRVVDSYESEIKYTFKPHRGVSSARNLGLKLSKGDFIAFLDSDDIWKKEKIRLQMQYMKAHPEAVVCCTQETWIRNGAFVNPRKKHRKHSGWIFDKVLPLCLLSLSSALFRRSLFDEIGVFDEDLPACEDYDLGIRLAHKYPVVFLNEPLIIKRGGHEDQLSKKYWGMDRFRVRALEKALTLDLSGNQERLVKKEMLKKCRVLINGFEKRGKKSGASEYKKVIEKYGLNSTEQKKERR
ncbi:MAG: glycosyltransferase family 2 protein [Candidatus Aminicenantes bacterium]|nr:glycosyltransferase family 2 protein [Candidatus Aminicenantes bacterium]